MMDSLIWALMGAITLSSAPILTEMSVPRVQGPVSESIDISARAVRGNFYRNDAPAGAYSFTTAFTGESGSAPFPMPVRSVHVVPASIVFQTWPATPVKPMIATYAVFAEPIRQIHTNARNRRLVGIDALSHSGK